MTTAIRVGRRTAHAGPAISAATQLVHLRISTLDDALSREVRDQLAWCAQGSRRSVVIDLCDLAETHVATVFALLAATSRRAHAAGSTLAVVNTPEELRRDLRIAGL